ncbi:glycosyltransferase family 2 protein [Paracoccus sp. JM45]|uniref:glycosyltransferase family 2 protein n=1 Tax=Paracoccus sp. JM45 TaxID=2283626 RepID=UPI000E6BB557|nr:glycosyltransferase family 2 protein [Paracoccus sp. JM45]RJE81519.1 hypothetical protein DWB67_02475 [Paracoccus sp. JM45]
MPVIPLRDFDSFLAQKPAQLAKGPLAIILVEDDVAVTQTIQHHLDRGFRHILLLSRLRIDLPEDLHAMVTQLAYDTRRPDAHVEGVNAVIHAVPAGTWMYYCFNGEFLFYPFSESRTVGEMLGFHTEERRRAMLTYVIDLYAPDMTQTPNAVDMDNAMFDKTGYYALGRKGSDGHDLERQLDFHGGLRWRYEEFLPPDRRRIDRIALFRSAPDLQVTADHRFSVPEYNTYACPWHHNLTAAIGSFRVAKALATNPGSRDRIGDMTWRNSHRFDWNSQQLMDLGLMEPGQWF